ncbi:hypothetical protein HDU88_002937 [Geranomyces variabilis]|nr:hypothetical protein HDU88_002937 [Geranomyces variabilis]
MLYTKYHRARRKAGAKERQRINWTALQKLQDSVVFINMPPTWPYGQSVLRNMRRQELNMWSLYWKEINCIPTPEPLSIDILFAKVHEADSVAKSMRPERLCQFYRPGAAKRLTPVDSAYLSTVSQSAVSLLAQTSTVQPVPDSRLLSVAAESSSLPAAMSLLSLQTLICPSLSNVYQSTVPAIASKRTKRVLPDADTSSTFESAAKKSKKTKIAAEYILTDSEAAIRLSEYNSNILSQQTRSLSSWTNTQIPQSVIDRLQLLMRKRKQLGKKDGAAYDNVELGQKFEFSGAAQFVRASAILRFITNDQIDDVGVNCWLYLLACRWDTCPHDWPRVYVIHSHTMTTSVSNPRLAFPSSRFDPQLYDVVVAPVHVGTNHWNLVWIDVKAKSATIFEPYAKLPLSTEVKAVCDFFSSRLWFTHYHEPKPLKFKVIRGTGTQSDNINCGVYICIAADMLIFHNNGVPRRKRYRNAEESLKNLTARDLDFARIIIAAGLISGHVFNDLELLQGNGYLA